MKKGSIVFFPLLGIGHLNPTIELAKRIAQHDHDHALTITILIMHSPFPTTTTNPSSSSSSSPNIHFIQLPPIDFIMDPKMGVLTLLSLTLLIEKHKPFVRTLLSSSTQPIRALIVDLFATAMIDVAAELDIPTYLYFTTSAATLALMLYMPTLDRQIESDLKDLDGLVEIPGMSPVPPLVMLDAMLNKKEEDYARFLCQTRRYREMRGLIVNTFEELEPRILEALVEGRCLPDCPTPPPVYPVGPLLSLDGESGGGGEEGECVKWLDAQPRCSVVFLCFGSLGAFDGAQVKEIAVGLERSGHRFLWCLRSPSPQGFGSLVDANLDEILPEGFLGRTHERGLVWPCWAPQLAILSHPATGGFVSHCGWNSCLESLWFGVPIIAWPLYAEQRLNGFLLAKDLGLVVDLGINYKGDRFVSAVELEKAVRVLMEGEEGQRVRRKAREVGEASREAVKEGGSSWASLARLVKEWAHDGAPS